MAPYANPGSDWNESDLLKFNIKRTPQQAAEFFGSELDSFDHLGLDPNLLLPIDGPIGPDVNKPTYRFLMNLRLASHGSLNRQGALQEFATLALEVMGYDERGMILRRQYGIPFPGNGKTSVLTPDVCLYSCRTGMIFLVARVDKEGVDVMAQIVADAIGAFELNNKKRERRGLSRLDLMVIPCITMFGTRPGFHKVTVTQQLIDAVRLGQYTKKPTIVTYCVPPWVPGRTLTARSPEDRQIILQYYAAFHGVVKDCSSQMLVIV